MVAPKEPVELTDPDTTASSLERFLASRWAPPAGTRALDLGCGDGQNSLLLAEHGYDVVGVDASEEAIDEARERAEDAEDVEFVVGRLADIDDFTKGEFGLVLVEHGLHPLVACEERKSFMGKIFRLMDRGAVFFADTITREGSFEPEEVGTDPETFVDEEGEHFWVSKIQLDEELREAGLTILHCYSYHTRPGHGLRFVNYALKR